MRGAVLILYDGDGNRVSETAGGVTTKYLVDTLNPTRLPQVLDEIVNGSVTRTYAYGRQRVGENQLLNGTWAPSFYGYDGHGNVRFLGNTAGAVTDTYQFDAFGNQIASSGTTPNSFLYSGEQFDSSTNLYELRDRWYRPTVGRFITRDPVEGMQCSPLSYNPYIYGSDDPVDRIDPTGRAGVLDYSRTLQIGVFASSGIILFQKQIACLLRLSASALYGISQNIGNIASIRLNFSTCSAEVEPKCPPCDPEAGTECYQPQSGHPHHEWDPHYHIWRRNQNPSTCQCFWNKGRGPSGTTQFPPVGMQPCSTYPTWPGN